MTRPRVWIDDPHPIFRRGLASTLSGEFRVAGESSELKPSPRPDSADVLVFDLTGSSLPQLGSFAATTVLVALVQRGNEHLRARALGRGVAALISRDALCAEKLLDSIRAAFNGQTTLPSDSVAEIMRSDGWIDPDRVGLIARELDVLRQLAEGGDTRSIAQEMSYSERTVKNVVHDLLIKMNCRNRAHAVAIAARQGLI